MGRTRGYWWAPDGTAVLVARVDETPVQRWYIADPANPARPGRARRLPGRGHAQRGRLAAPGRPGRAAGWTSNRTGAAFPYLVTVCWDAGRIGHPLIVVQSRDQRVMRILAADPATGATTVLREDTDPRLGRHRARVPAWTAAAGSSGPPTRTAPGGCVVGTGRAAGGRARSGDPGRSAGPRGPRRRRRHRPVHRVGTSPTAIGLWRYRPGRPRPVSAARRFGRARRAAPW